MVSDANDALRCAEKWRFLKLTMIFERQSLFSPSQFTLIEFNFFPRRKILLLFSDTLKGVAIPSSDLEQPI
jgi:hypothetical protein